MKGILARRNRRRFSMKDSTRRRIDLPLFRTMLEEQVLDLCQDRPRDLLLALSIARMEHLRSFERLLLYSKVSCVEDLAHLDSESAGAMVYRKLPMDRWNPALAIEKARHDREFLDIGKADFVIMNDCRYPPQLREVYRPPFGLFVKGSLPNPQAPAVAIVGTRIPTGRGVEAAYRLASQLSALGICIVSGLARGIDSAAHRAALRNKGKTVAILPAGMDSIYPPSNRRLAAEILDSGGGIASEYPPCTDIHIFRFPERNRIIAGLCRSCVVIEAPERSGALITADHALTEGRDVFIHKACRGSVRNAGADLLFQQGAIAVESAQDILREWLGSNDQPCDAVLPGGQHRPAIGEA
jgi:DNA processing protein